MTVTCKTCDKREFQTGKDVQSLCSLTNEPVWSYVQLDKASKKCPLSSTEATAQVTTTEAPVTTTPSPVLVVETETESEAKPETKNDSVTESATDTQAESNEQQTESIELGGAPLFEQTATEAPVTTTPAPLMSAQQPLGQRFKRK